MVATMVVVMGWLWLLPWDGYGCCYGWYHGMAMVAAMIVAMVVAMVAAMVLENDGGQKD